MSERGERAAIVLGGDGQDGRYLRALLAEQGLRVLSLGRPKGPGDFDLHDHSQVVALIAAEQPDFVFHLAANSTTRYSAWRENHATIATGTLNLLDAVQQHAPEARVFLAGSGLQFVNHGEPIHEDDPFEARDPYCVSRIQSVYAARYFRTLGRRVYVGYFFHHDSPLRTARHVNQKIAQAARRIAAGSDEQLIIGDVSVCKEFGFAGDHVRAIWQLVNQDEVHEAVIGTGEAHSIEEWLACCFRWKDLDWRQHVVAAEGFEAEYGVLVSRPSTIRALGWTPRVGLPELARMMMAG